MEIIYARKSGKQRRRIRDRKMKKRNCVEAATINIDVCLNKTERAGKDSIRERRKKV